jgi:xanthine permease XanP
MIVVGVSLGVGLGLAAAPEVTGTFPGVLRSLFESPISGGGVTAIVLGLVLPGRTSEMPDGS